MKRFLTYFLRGLVFLAPIGITLYVCWLVFSTIDGWLGLPVPGAGFVVTVLLITLVGFLATNLLTRGLLGLVENAIGHLPFVKLLYSSTRDLLNAFVGEKRRFDVSAIVELVPGGPRALGFVTQQSASQLGLAGWVAVYLPQSYNFAGQVLLFPSDRVERLAAPSSDVMAFIVSGGVTAIPGSGSHAEIDAPSRLRE